MGLDMYLYKGKRIKGLTVQEMHNIEQYLDWRDCYVDECSLEEYCFLKEEDINQEHVKLYETSGIKLHNVGYWRKANQIHNWFVNNVQNGYDDCEYYEATKLQLEELLEICKMVVLKAIIGEGIVFNYSTFKENEKEVIKRGYIVKENKSKHSMIDVFSKGQVILNSDEIAKLLPTTEGFFFGNTNYDMNYLEDVKNTIELLEEVLSTTDFDNEIIIYTSSW